MKYFSGFHGAPVSAFNPVIRESRARYNRKSPCVTLVAAKVARALAFVRDSNDRIMMEWANAQEDLNYYRTAMLLL